MSLLQVRVDSTVIALWLGRADVGEIPMSLLGELVDLFNERYGAELGEVEALKVMTDVRDNVRDENPDSPTRPKPTLRSGGGADLRCDL